MSKEKTETISRGEKIKKFKMPKFPSALVVLFVVLLFVVLLSWIPHKGWVDTTNPLFYIKEDGIYGPNSIYPFATWESVPNWDKVVAGDQVILELTDQGITWAGKILLSNGYDISKIADSNTNEIIISGLILEGDWNKAAINYSGFSFYIGTDSLNKAFLVEFDKVYVSKLMVGESADTVFTFNVLSVVIGDNAFASENVANNWFNFFDTNYFVGDSNGRYGILNLPFLIIAGIFNASGIILFILCTGAFINVMVQSKALEAGTVSLVNRLKGKELLLIPIFFILFCFIGTAAGMQAAVLGLVPLVVPFLVFAGFDTMTGLLVIVIGNTSGIAASILDPFSVAVMASSLETVGPEITISVGTGIVIRIIEFFTFVAVGSLFCTWYGNKSRKGKDFVAEPEMYEANKEWAEEMLGDTNTVHDGLTKRQAIGLGIFAATFGIMLFGLLPWTTWFEGLQTADGWAAISSIFFAKVLFGQWFFVQLSFLFLTSGIILGKVFGMKQKETNKAIVKGARGMFGVALILSITRSVSLVLTFSGLTTAMIGVMFAGASGDGIQAMGLAWLLFPVFCLLAIFISSTSGLAAITGPIIAPMIWQLSLAAQNGANSLDANRMFFVYGAVVMATYPLAQGIINMCMPTTGIVVVQADLARVNFGKAFKLLGIAAIGIGIIGMLIISASIPIMMASVPIII